MSLIHLIYGSILYVPPLSGQMMMMFSFVFSMEADDIDAELDSVFQLLELVELLSSSFV
jgi:hypothetical protein